MVENFWTDKRVLVTGGHGFLGKHLVGLLEEKSCNLFVPSSDECDFRLLSDVRSIFKSIGEVDVLFHLAARVGGIGYNQDHPYDLFYDNAIMGIRLINTSAIEQVGKFVQIGTTCSYPEYCPAPFNESDLFNGYPEKTNAAYGIAKRALLTQLQAAREQFNLNGIYVVPTNLYGPEDNFSDDKSHVIPALIKKVLAAKTSVDVWGTGNASRDFLYVEDAAKGIIAAAEKYNEPGPINLGSGKSTTIAALVNIIKELTGSEAKTIWKVDKPDGQMERLLDISKANDLLGWQPEVELREGLERTIKWYLEEADA